MVLVVFIGRFYWLFLLAAYCWLHFIGCFYRLFIDSFFDQVFP